MNDLWMVGFTGAAVGAALGWPLLRAPGARLLGSLLFLGSLAAATIAARHGAILPTNIATISEHVIYAGDLIFWAALVIWVRSAMGYTTAIRDRTTLVGTPLVAYAVIAAWTGDAPRFIWLLPVGTAASSYVYVLWNRHPHERGEGLRRELLARMVALAVAMNLAQAIRTFFPDVSALREIVPITMTAAFLSIAALAVRHLLHSGSQMVSASVAAIPTASAIANATTNPSVAPRYAKSALDQQSAGALLDALDRGMRDEHWYRDASLSLAELASRLQSRPHLLSQALNQVKGTTLHEYLQVWRVEEARRLLVDPASDRFTIDALAESAGFASRSAFYKAFKAHQGMTPSEFRARSRDM